MAYIQKYGIKYPLTSENNENVFLDLNQSYAQSVKSKVLHVALTQKGQRLRNPDFGTNLINYIFGAFDDIDMSEIKSEVSRQISKYVPNVSLDDIAVYRDESDEHNMIVSITYTLTRGNNVEATTVAVKL